MGEIVPKEKGLAKSIEPEGRLARVEKSIERMEQILMREIEAKKIEEEPKFQSELRDRDYRSHLTMGLTLGDPTIISRMSDVGSPQEMACVTGWAVDGEFMSPLFDRPRVILLDHKVSKDRKGREESRDILKGSQYMQDQFGTFNTGLPLLRAAIEKQKEEDDG
jgi:hypothetical protein